MDSRIKKLATKPVRFWHASIIQICLLFFLLNNFTLVSALPVDSSLTIPELVSQLQAQGYQILYSSSLVNKQMKVSNPRKLDERKLDWLKRCLLHHNLGLKKQGEVYIITLLQTDKVPKSTVADARTIVRKSI